MKTQRQRHQRERNPVNRPPKKPYGRPLHMRDGAVWRYKITGAGIRFITPEGKKVFIDESVFLGYHCDEDFYLEIGPGDVKAFIENFAVEGPDCPGSGQYLKPGKSPHGPWLAYTPEEEVCPECGRDVCRACADARNCPCQTRGENHDPESSPVAEPDPGDATESGGDEEPEFFIVHASELEGGDATDEAA